jgi:hypothetical protein
VCPCFSDSSIPSSTSWSSSSENAARLYSTLESTDSFDFDSNYGEDGILNVGRTQNINSEEFFLEDEIIDLMEELKTLKIHYTSAKLTMALKRLHDFGYITITEINLANTYEGAKVHNRKSTRARLRHIRLSEEMQKKNLSNRWVRKPTKPTKPKV